MKNIISFDENIHLARISELVPRSIDATSVLVTGASGVIGLNFINALISLNRMGWNFDIVATVSTSRPMLEKYFEENNVKVIKVDLTLVDQISFDRCFDIIVYAATYGQPGKFLSNKIKTLELNSSGLMAVSKSLKKNGHLVYLSSSELYSGVSGEAAHEDTVGHTTPQHPRSSYIEAKRFGEAFCEALSNKGYSCYSIRLSLAYGPGAWIDDERVLNQFIVRALTLGKIQMLDSGAARRCYLYVDDAIFMILSILFRGKHRVYNVGGMEEISISHLANLICESTSANYFSGPIEAGLDGAPQAVSINLNRYFSEFPNLKFTPISDGLKSTINWYRGLLKNA